MSTKNTICQIIRLGLVVLGIGISVGYSDLPDEKKITESIQGQLKLLDQIPTEETVVKPKLDAGAGIKGESHKAEEPKKIIAEIWTEQKDGKPRLIVNFDNGLPYPCMFRRGDFVYLALSFPTDINKKKWSDKVVPELTDMEILTFDDATVLRWKMDSVYPRLKIDSKANQFVIDLSEKTPCEDGFDLEVFQPRRKGDVFKATLKNAQTDLTLDIENNGHDVWLVFADQTNRLLPLRDYPEFTILESYQGVAIDLKSEGLDYSYIRKSIYMTKHGGIGNTLAQMAMVPVMQKTIFDDFSPENPSEKVRELILKVYSGNPNLEDAVDLVWNYLVQGLALETQGVMHEISVKNQDLSLMYLWRAFGGLAALMRGQYDVAQKNLGSIKGEPDVAFWLSIAFFCGNKVVDAKQLAALIAGKKYLFKLPPIVRDKLWARILEFGLLNEHQKVLEEFTLKGEVPTTRIAKPIYNLVSACLQLDPNNPTTVNDLFDIWQGAPGTKVGVLAQFERLKFLHKVKKIEPEQGFKQLEKLRFQWRGDHLEYRINKYLIDRYMEEKQYAKLLPVARKTIKYFVTQSHDDGLPKLMQEALVKYFQQDHLPVLEMLSIFQEYTSIAPDNEQGDMIMIKATNVLANLELYDVVVNLLRDYLVQKAKDGPDVQSRRDHILYRMAVAYHLDRKFSDALKTLSEITDAPEDLTDDVAILKSEAYLQSGQHDKAISALGDTAPQLIHKSEILLGDRKWSQAQDVYHGLLFNEHKISDSDKAQAIVSYVLCLYMDKQSDKLKEASSKFSDFMKDKPGLQAFELMTVPDAKVSLTHLQSVQQVATFTDRLKGLFANKT